jgi:DNA-binding NtrC family response regulator
MEQPSTATILCVDDEETPLLLRKKVLERFGYEVYTATSAQQALNVMAGHHVDLVVTDQLMPQVPGTELAKMVKSASPGVPVVILSGVNDIPSGAEYADLFVSKLEGPTALCERVKTLLELSPHSGGSQHRR